MRGLIKLGYNQAVKLETRVGQIFLTHPKDQNYTSLYEEALTKGGETLELFCVIEIDEASSLAAAKKIEYDKLAQTLVLALKKTYVAAPIIDGDSFEKALGAVNAALSRVARNGRVTWFNKLHVALATLYKNELSVAVCGNAQVFLLRAQEFAILSDDLAADRPSPTKTFSNYTTGRLAASDRVVLSTNQLFNHLSIERLKKIMTDEALDDACQEMIAALADVKTFGFATFIFETIGPNAKKTAETEKEDELPAFLSAGATSKTAGRRILLEIAGLGASLLKFLWWFAKRLGLAVISTIRPEKSSTKLPKLPGAKKNLRKKIIAYAVGLLILTLLVTVAVGAVRKSINSRRVQETSKLAQIEIKLNDAEAALIYNDEGRAVALVSEATTLLSAYPNDNTGKQNLEVRLLELKNKMGKVLAIDNPAVLTTFPNIPTALLHSSQGFLGFNSNTGSLAFYNFATAETKPLLTGMGTGNLSAGVYLGADYGFAFLARDGQFMRLNLAADALEPFGSATPDPNLVRASSLAILGAADSARLYFLNENKTQIWRAPMRDGAPAPSEKWLKVENANFSGATNIAVDGAIYFNFADRIEKYFNGTKQNFSLAAVLPPLTNSAKIYTSVELQSLYLLDPSNLRVLIFSKAGKLTRQITSPKFNELADIFVDEANKLLYVLSGSELLKIGF